MLINCVAYRDGQRLADVFVEDIANWVGGPTRLLRVGGPARCRPLAPRAGRL